LHIRSICGFAFTSLQVFFASSLINNQNHG
jgi:hypothetical protein